MNAVEFRTFPTIEAADNAVAELMSQGVSASELSVLRVEDELVPPEEAPTEAAELRRAEMNNLRPANSSVSGLTDDSSTLREEPLFSPKDDGEPVTPETTGVGESLTLSTEDAEDVPPASPEEPDTDAAPLIKRVGAGIGLGALAAGATLAVPGIGLVLGSGLLAGAVAAMVKSSSDDEDRHTQARKLFLEAGADEALAQDLAERWIKGETIIRIEKPAGATEFP